MLINHRSNGRTISFSLPLSTLLAHNHVILKIHFYPVLVAIEEKTTGVYTDPFDAQQGRMKRMRPRYRVHRARQARSSLCLRLARSYAQVGHNEAEERATRNTREKIVSIVYSDSTVALKSSIVYASTFVLQKWKKRLTCSGRLFRVAII